jgi:hypothetical protein
VQAAVWNAPRTTYTQLIFGQGVNLAGTAVAAIWDALLTGFITIGSVGKKVKDLW